MAASKSLTMYASEQFPVSINPFSLSKKDPISICRRPSLSKRASNSTITSLFTALARAAKLGSPVHGRPSSGSVPISAVRELPRRFLAITYRCPRFSLSRLRDMLDSLEFLYGEWKEPSARTHHPQDECSG